MDSVIDPTSSIPVLACTHRSRTAAPTGRPRPRGRTRPPAFVSGTIVMVVNHAVHCTWIVPQHGCYVSVSNKPTEMERRKKRPAPWHCMPVSHTRKRPCVVCCGVCIDMCVEKEGGRYRWLCLAGAFNDMAPTRFPHTHIGIHVHRSSRRPWRRCRAAERNSSRRTGP